MTEKQLHLFGIRKIGDLAALDEQFLQQRFGKWGLALAGKALGLDAGGWFDAEVGTDEEPKSISHEHTFGTDTADRDQLHSIIARLSEMVGRRLREHKLLTRTVQIKLRYTDFSTFTRAHSLDQATQIDTVLLNEAWKLFEQNWTGKPIRLIGVHAGNLAESEGQTSLLAQDHTDRWTKALNTVDKLRDKFGENSVSLAASLKGRFRERVRWTSGGLPGKKNPP